MAAMDRAQLGAMNGVLPADTPMWAMMPSAADRSQVPPGSAGDTMYMFCTAVPHEFADGSDWSEHRAAVTAQSVKAMDRVAPGFADAAIGSWAKSPNELGEQTHRGSFTTVDLSLSQLGPNRPSRSLSGYKTPIENLWHTGAGAHPMSGVHGWAGRTTARTVLKAMRKS
jgi:beta-carotene ketolase (CrtO type)